MPHGFAGAFARPFVEGRLKAAARKALRALRGRLESGLPPTIPVL
jgi:hypothetical protein